MPYRSLLVSACLATAAFAQSDAGQAVPPPPSTGVEAPDESKTVRLPSEDALEQFAELLATATSPTQDCAKLVTPHTRLLLSVAEPKAPFVKEHLDGYLVLARCAEKLQWYGLMYDLSAAMALAGDEAGHPELLVRSLMGLEAWERAAKVIVALEKAMPDDPDVALTKAKLLCRVRDWAGCLKASSRTIELGKTMTDHAQQKEILNRAFKYVARGLLHAGKLDDALLVADEAQKIGGDPAALDALRQSVVEAQTAGVVADLEPRTQFALGTYHLQGKVKGLRPLLELDLTRVEKGPKQYRVEVEVAGITSRFSKSVVTMPLKDQHLEVSPPLKHEFDPATVRAARTAQLDVTITAIEKGGDRVVLQKSFPLTLQPRDFLPLASFSDKEGVLGQLVNDNIAAWVTPNATSVDAFLAAAKQRAPRSTFAGEQSATVPQVKALYDELQARGMSYVMDPSLVVSDGVQGQRTRLPSEVLTSTNAQCLEGSILYATLFEAIGLKPVIIRVPGHAFVGWVASPKYDKVPPGTVFFLETTMTHDAPFSAANARALEEYKLHDSHHAAHLIQVEALRKAGVSPQPY